MGNYLSPAFVLNSRWARRFCLAEEARDGRTLFQALEGFLLSLPILGVACVIHRPGYVARYQDRYKEALWYMCKTAFSILIERAAKFADEQDRFLEVVFEGAGKKRITI